MEMGMILTPFLYQNMTNMGFFFILNITDIFMNPIYFLLILFFRVGVKGASRASTWWTGHELNGRSCVSLPWWVTQKALAETHPCIHAPIDVGISKTNGLTTVTYLVAALDDLCSRVKRLSVCVCGGYMKMEQAYGEVPVNGRTQWKAGFPVPVRIRLNLGVIMRCGAKPPHTIVVSSSVSFCYRFCFGSSLHVSRRESSCSMATHLGPSINYCW